MAHFCDVIVHFMIIHSFNDRLINVLYKTEENCNPIYFNILPSNVSIRRLINDKKDRNQYHRISANYIPRYSRKYFGIVYLGCKFTELQLKGRMSGFCILKPPNNNILLNFYKELDRLYQYSTGLKYVKAHATYQCASSFILLKIIIRILELYFAIEKSIRYF